MYKQACRVLVNGRPCPGELVFDLPTTAEVYSKAGVKTRIALEPYPAHTVCSHCLTGFGLDQHHRVYPELEEEDPWRDW